MNPDIFSVFYSIFKDFGINALGFGIVIFLIWKLITNHIFHIAKDVKSIGKNLKKNTKMTVRLGERVSKLEGKFDK